jgi:hypothetical protein
LVVTEQKDSIADTAIISPTAEAHAKNPVQKFERRRIQNIVAPTLIIVAPPTIQVRLGMSPSNVWGNSASERRTANHRTN